MSEYEAVARSKLRLKGEAGIKKKKKNKQKEKKFFEQVKQEMKSEESEHELTPAEQSFLKQQEKLQKQSILEKASMTHKQRVEEFNRKLDGLTEHFDIPKVSWTK